MNFLDPPSQYQEDTADYHVVPCPFEGKTTYGDGAQNGAEAIIEASKHLPYYDSKTGIEPYKRGIHTHDECKDHGAIRDAAENLAGTNTLPCFLGGDHSITIPTVAPLHSSADVLILDAHSDMHYKWNGSTTNHACVTRNISADRHVTVIGARSMDRDEHVAARNSDNVDLVSPGDVLSYDLDTLSNSIHISVDVDAFDPSIIDQTGTPEPNGLTYETIHRILNKAFEEKTVVSIDIVEYSPSDDEPASKRAQSYTLAKLIYQAFSLHAKVNYE